MQHSNEIQIIGARENNLKNITLNIPKNKLIVLTGVSGSGKSSIAFETLQKECQRQYMESLGMGMEHKRKPMVDKIIGLSPSISVSQYSYNSSPRSTVGTLTDLYTYLRLLYARIGSRKCSNCGELLKPVLQTKISEGDLFDEDASSVEDEVDSIEEDFVEQVRCPKCNHLIKPLSISSFSFNKVEGACPTCKGLGIVSRVDPKKVINDELSIADGAVQVWGKGEIELYGGAIAKAAVHYGFPFDLNTPVKNLHEAAREILYYGVYSYKIKHMYPDIEPPTNINYGRFTGAINVLSKRLLEHQNEDRYREQVHKYMVKAVCTDCNGAKLRKESLDVLIMGKNISEVSNMSLLGLRNWVLELNDSLSSSMKEALKDVLDQFLEKINNLIDAGVSYLSLSRTSSTLSAGEVQRIRIASLLGTGLTGVLYVLDEPTVGLHQRDTKNLIQLMRKLCDGENTVLVIEHNMDVMRAADYIIDIGPGAGKNGGELVFAGEPKDILNCEESVTGKCLSGAIKLNIPKKYREGNGKKICILEATENNLKNIDVEIPLGMLVAVTGVTGAGKSSLVFNILNKSANVYFNNDWNKPGSCREITGFENISSVVSIDQSSIGRMVRSNAATYTDVFTSIRNFYTQLPEAKEKNIPSKYFSFNTQGGRCEKCYGFGSISVNMQFLPSVEMRCPVCKGKRFKKSILDITYNGCSISDVLDMTVDEALTLFKNVKSVEDKLKVLSEVGLGYLKLGQPTTTLSGGEAQRIKISKELSRKKNGNILYILDEPTSGLHPSDTIKLMKVINKLVDNGNSVIMIEHNVNVIRTCDYIIDLGLDGGEFGGNIIAQGRPEEVMKVENSVTAQALRSL